MRQRRTQVSGVEPAVPAPSSSVPPYLTERVAELQLSGGCQFLLAVTFALVIATLVFSILAWVATRDLRRFIEAEGEGESASFVSGTMAQTAQDMAVAVFKRRAKS